MYASFRTFTRCFFSTKSSAATMITKQPNDQTVNASSTVTFDCDATTDLEEKAHLEIKWLKDGEEINYESERTISLNKRVRFLLSTMKIPVTLKIVKKNHEKESLWKTNILKTFEAFVYSWSQAVNFVNE